MKAAFPGTFKSSLHLFRRCESRIAPYHQSRRLISDNAAFKVKTKPIRKPSRILRGVGYLGLFVSGVYVYDNYFNSSRISRSLRTIYHLGIISIDYKLNFEEGKDIEALHERGAERLYKLLTTNKGLYIKMGQLIAIQGSMFPINYQVKFRQLFDSAPRDDWETAESVLIEGLGPNYMDHFQSFDHEPIASASVAQVHKAVLKDGSTVAVKVQHRDVANQVDTDLLVYRMAMSLYEYIFDMPITTTVNYVCKKMKEEVDFTIEQSNGKFMAKSIAADKEFRDNVYIPKYYEEMTSKKILVAEWIDGESVIKFKDLATKGYNTRNLTYEIVTCFARQIFTWGIVHCDPHPGNLIVRKLPSGKQQLVILDHGLYEIFDSKFRREFSQLWKALLEQDSPAIVKVLREWGLNGEDMFMTMMSSDPSKTKEFKENQAKMENMSFFERQKLIKEKMKEFFENTDKFPFSIIFVMRSLRILAGINKNFGSPVNRMELLAEEAKRTVLQYEKAENAHINQIKLLQRSLYFSLFKIASIISFYFYQFKETLYSWIYRDYQAVGLEDRYEQQMISRSKEMGYEVPEQRDLFE